MRTTAAGGRVRECKIVAEAPDGTLWVMAGVLHSITAEHPYEIYIGEGASRRVVAVVPGPVMFEEHERQRAGYARRRLSALRSPLGSDVLRRSNCRQA